jgi:hypothetical protein
LKWLRGQDLKRFPEGRGRSQAAENARKTRAYLARKSAAGCQRLSPTATALRYGRRNAICIGKPVVLSPSSDTGRLSAAIDSMGAVATGAADIV